MITLQKESESTKTWMEVQAWDIQTAAILEKARWTEDVNWEQLVFRDSI